MDDDLVCNFKKCRKRLKTFAWATSCSHIFCEEDGSREFNKRCVCPACDTELPGKYDIVRVDLQPSEEYKSMVLAGQRPDIIAEICSRALSFWTYQAHQERTFQEYCATKAREKVQQLESYYEQLITRTQAELSAVKTQTECLKKELESTKLKYSETSEKFMEKSRQYQKLQGMYDSLRRRNVTMSSFEFPDQNIPDLGLPPPPPPQPHLSGIARGQSRTHLFQLQPTKEVSAHLPIGFRPQEDQPPQRPPAQTSSSSSSGIAAAIKAGAFHHRLEAVTGQQKPPPADPFVLDMTPSITKRIGKRI